MDSPESYWTFKSNSVCIMSFVTPETNCLMRFSCHMTFLRSPDCCAVMHVQLTWIELAMQSRYFGTNLLHIQCITTLKVLLFFMICLPFFLFCFRFHVQRAPQSFTLNDYLEDRTLPKKLNL